MHQRPNDSGADGITTELEPNASENSVLQINVTSVPTETSGNPQKMNPTPSHPNSAARSRRIVHVGEYKDVYFPTMLAGESPIESRVRHHFEWVGYKITRIETAPTHPTLIVRAVRASAPRIDDPRLFFKHIQALLRQIGFFPKKDELTVDREKERILFAFPSGDPPADPMEILREQHLDLIDDADMPL